MPKKERLKTKEIINIPVITESSSIRAYFGILMPQFLHLPLHMINDITGSWRSGGILTPQLSQAHLEERTEDVFPLVRRMIFVVANPPI